MLERMYRAVGSLAEEADFPVGVSVLGTAKDLADAFHG